MAKQWNDIDEMTAWWTGTMQYTFLSLLFQSEGININLQTVLLKQALQKIKIKKKKQAISISA